MINYLEARMSTPYSPGVKDTAVGLEALVAQTRYNPSDSVEICRSVFSNSPHFNEYTASVRIEVYRLLDTLLNSNRDGLKEHSGGFIVGLISLAELEKDPRNLMIYFSMLHVVLSEWEIGDHAKDLWDAVSKYFPITFRPRPDDPIGITADDLKQRLRLCISATSEFAPWVFSFLIEKLDDQVTANVKVSELFI
jgi:DNA repair/transcription protein MET18/MMS19